MAQSFGSETTDSMLDAARVASLIGDLDRTLRQLDFEIRAEEERTKSFDPDSIAYPPLARSLRIRRDNLTATIATLELKAGSPAIQTAA
jgi:hypothetical protein